MRSTMVDLIAKLDLEKNLKSAVTLLLQTILGNFAAVRGESEVRALLDEYNSKTDEIATLIAKDKYPAEFGFKDGDFARLSGESDVDFQNRRGRTDSEFSRRPGETELDFQNRHGRRPGETDADVKARQPAMSDVAAVKRPGESDADFVNRLGRRPGESDADFLSRSGRTDHQDFARRQGESDADFANRSGKNVHNSFPMPGERPETEQQRVDRINVTNENLESVVSGPLSGPQHETEAQRIEREKLERSKQPLPVSPSISGKRK